MICAASVAASHCYESPKPEEFGLIGSNWSDIGWKVDINYVPMPNPIRPADHMELLGPLLPERYSPLQASGRGQQSVYLTELPAQLATALVGLLGHDARVVVQGNYVTDKLADMERTPATLEYEELLAASISADENIPETDRKAIVIARRGQGKFKKNVQKPRSSLCV